MTARVSWRDLALLALFAATLMLPGFFTLPPVDRDEPRFAQASKQMIVSGNYADIYFQDEPRYKKPIGIYWLQTASARLLGAPPYDRIWPYRLPSLLGAIAAVLITAAGTARLTDRRTGLIAGAVLACSGLLNVEARLAKTDAALLAAICGAQFIMARAYVAAARGGTLPRSLAWLFWGCEAAGILLKGPIAPLVGLLTVATLGVADRKLGWLRQLRPLSGLALCAALAGPWLVWIGLKSGGGFYADAVGHDLLGKIFTAQDRSFLPPLYHLALLAICFGPFFGAAMLGVRQGWRERADPALRFVLAWAVPGWIFYELIFTKLPHYALPFYPPLALLAARMLNAPAKSGRRHDYARFALLLPMLLFGAAVAALPHWLGEKTDLHVSLMIFAALGMFALQARLQGEGERLAPLLGLCGSAMFMTAVFGLLLPRLDAPWLPARMAALYDAGRPCTDSRLIAAGNGEPSLVFLAGTGTIAAADAGQAAKLMKIDACAVAMIPAQDEALFMQKTVAETYTHIGTVRGYQYNGGGWQEFSFYRHAASGVTP